MRVENDLMKYFPETLWDDFIETGHWSDEPKLIGTQNKNLGEGKSRTIGIGALL